MRAVLPSSTSLGLTRLKFADVLAPESLPWASTKVSTTATLYAFFWDAPRPADLAQVATCDIHRAAKEQVMARFRAHEFQQQR